ncbi:MAG: carboxylesterase family protein [Peptococcaceae bacterium]|nr:carboxylesterase family protein [Peptococcaceae bacterium]
MTCTVTCHYGTLQGTQEKQCTAFYNVPYAKGNGRFRYAIAPDAWQGVYDATKPGAIFPQKRSRLYTIMGEQENLPQDENAFTLNIWTPDTKGSYPVCIWIHGGRWLTGGAGLSWYHGSNLAHQNLVVVSVQYRLGVLGNLYQPEISDGNLAVHDLISAILWIKENISAFGGDTGQITIAGQSAGAWYTVILLGIEQLRGTFQRAILCSFPGGVTPLCKNDAAKMSQLLLNELHITNVHELATISAQDLLNAESKVSEEMQRRKNQMMEPVFLPYADSIYVQKDIIKAAAENSQGSLQLMTGITAQETMAFLNDSSIADHNKVYQTIVQISTQHIFLNPTIALLNQFSAQGNAVYAYHFAYPCKNTKIQACHCIDLPFIFGNFDCWESAPMCHFDSTEETQALSTNLQSSLIQFMKEGIPDNQAASFWPQYDKTERKALQFWHHCKPYKLTNRPLIQLQIHCFLFISKCKSLWYTATHKL